MNGSAIAFVLVITTIGKSIIATESAIVNIEIIVAPNGATARGGGVVAEVAAVNRGRAMVHKSTSAGITTAINDAATVDRQGFPTVIDDTATVNGLAVGDGDIVQGHLAVIANTAAVVGPTAGEGAIFEGEVARTEHLDDMAIGTGTSEARALQGVAVEVDGDGLAAVLPDFEVSRQRDVVR